MGFKIQKDRRSTLNFFTYHNGCSLKKYSKPHYMLKYLYLLNDYYYCYNYNYDYHL